MTEKRLLVDQNALISGNEHVYRSQFILDTVRVEKDGKMTVKQIQEKLKTLQSGQKTLQTLKHLQQDGAISVERTEQTAYIVLNKPAIDPYADFRPIPKVEVVDNESESVIGDSEAVPDDVDVEPNVEEDTDVEVV